MFIRASNTRKLQCLALVAAVMLVSSIDPVLLKQFYPDKGFDRSEKIRGDPVSCPAASCPPCLAEDSLWSIMVSAIVYLATTIEVLIRGFSLGFGTRMLKFILWDDAGESLDHLKDRMRVSFVAGLAMSSFIFGSSLFLPAKMREYWFSDD